jgi:hypothetical protein
MGSKDRIVGLDYGVGESRSRVDTELQLGLLAVVGRETLKNEGTKTRSSSTTERVEDEESLQTTTVVGETTDLVHDGIDHLFSNGVVSTSI